MTPIPKTTPERLTALETKMDVLHEDIGEIKRDVKSIVSEQLPPRVGRLEDRMEQYEKTVDHICAEVAGLPGKVKVDLDAIFDTRISDAVGVAIAAWLKRNWWKAVASIGAIAGAVSAILNITQKVWGWP